MPRRSPGVRLDALLRAASDVIAERGLANTRTADVAAAAGVSQALLFYHFQTKERLVAEAFAYTAAREVARVEATLRAGAAPLETLRRLLRLYRPAGRARPWALWIDAWSESLRVPELERASRRLDARWREALTEVITAGTHDGSLKCDDPSGAAWRIAALIDGLAVQATVHPRSVSRRDMAGWVRAAAAREVGLEGDQLA
ncbi:MAG TPA: TetR/AcrR family transcriptional regulator [Pilimelia sp.]|nr:TetR/AcrR family transcriptional regulator [Pilimelia sp.]